MGSKLSHRIVSLVAALAVAVTPVAAGADPPKNYSMNSAGGDYAPAVVHKNYGLNGATGDYAPVYPRDEVAPILTPPARPGVRVADSSFAWSDAAVGAGTALLAVLLTAGVTRRIRRRHIGAPRPVRPSAI